MGELYLYSDEVSKNVRQDLWMFCPLPVHFAHWTFRQLDGSTPRSFPTKSFHHPPDDSSPRRLPHTRGRFVTWTISPVDVDNNHDTDCSLRNTSVQYRYSNIQHTTSWRPHSGLQWQNWRQLSMSWAFMSRDVGNCDDYGNCPLSMPMLCFNWWHHLTSRQLLPLTSLANMHLWLQHGPMERCQSLTY